MSQLTSPLLPEALSCQAPRFGNGAPLKTALRLETIRTPEGLAALEGEWTELFHACAPRPTVFQSFAWAQGIVRSANNTSTPYILTARADDRLVAVAPLALESRLGGASLRWIGGGLAIYGDVLAAPGVDVGAWLREALDGITARRDAQSLMLNNVRDDAIAADFLCSAARDVGHIPAPWIDMAAAGSFGVWRQGLSRSTRRGRSRRLRDLEARGTVSFDFARHASSSAQRIGRLIEMKRAWMDARSVVSRTIGNTDFEILVARLATQTSEIDSRISTLQLDGEPIAIELGFVTGRRYLSYLGAYDPAYSDYSPGALQLERTLEACFDEGLEVFDLLPLDDDYKKSWASHAACVRNHVLPLTSIGLLHQEVARVDPVGMAKACIRHIPTSYRRPLQALVRRQAGAKPHDATAKDWFSATRLWLARATQVCILTVATWMLVAE